MLAAGLALLLALLVAGPAIASLTMGLAPPGGATRYVTYDAELSLLGIPLDVTTARWIGFTAGPCLLALAIGLLAAAFRSGAPQRDQATD